MKSFAACAAAVITLVAPVAAQPPRVLTVDHKVKVQSTVPAFAATSTATVATSGVTLITRATVSPGPRSMSAVRNDADKFAP